MNRKESDVGIKYKNGNAYSTVCPYDVDDVYVTFSSVNPATRWPGTTWTLVTAGTFLVAGASSGTYEVGNTGGEAAHVITNGEMPSHNHIWYLGGKERVGYDISGSAGSFVAGLASKTATSGDAITIGSTGGGAAHNNMPPYIACYMWRRTGGGASPCSDAEGGEALCLSSSSRAGTTGKPSAHGALETSCSQRPPRTRTSNGRGLLGRSTRRTGSPSAQARRTHSELPEEPQRIRTRSTGLDMPVSALIPGKCTGTLRPASVGSRLIKRAIRLTRAGARTAVKSRVRAFTEALVRRRACRHTLPSTFGGALHRGAVA